MPRPSPGTRTGAPPTIMELQSLVRPGRRPQSPRRRTRAACWLLGVQLHAAGVPLVVGRWCRRIRRSRGGLFFGAGTSSTLDREGFALSVRAGALATRGRRRRNEAGRQFPGCPTSSAAHDLHVPDVSRSPALAAQSVRRTRPFGRVLVDHEHRLRAVVACASPHCDGSAPVTLSRSRPDRRTVEGAASCR